MVAKHRNALLVITITVVSFVFLANWWATRATPEPDNEAALVTPTSVPPQLQPLPDGQERQESRRAESSSAQRDGNVRTASHSAAAALAMASVGQPPAEGLQITQVSDGEYAWPVKVSGQEIYLFKDRLSNVVLHAKKDDDGSHELVLTHDGSDQPKKISVDFANGKAPIGDELSQRVGRVDVRLDEKALPLFTLFVPPQNPTISTPVIMHVAQNDFVEPRLSSTLVNVYGVEPTLHLVGRNRVSDAQYTFFRTRTVDGLFQLYEVASQPTVRPTAGPDARWEADVRLSFLDAAPQTPDPQHLLIRVTHSGEHVYAEPPLKFQKLPQANVLESPTVDFHPDGGTQPETDDDDDVIEYLNSRQWPVVITLSRDAIDLGDAKDIVVVLRSSERSEPVETLPISANDIGKGVKAELTGLAIGSQRLRAEVWQGSELLTQADGSSASFEVAMVHVRTGGLQVKRVEPENFGTAPGVRSFKIHFAGPNRLAFDTDQMNKLKEAIELLPSGAGGEFAFSTKKDPTEVEFDPETNVVTVRFQSVEAALYQLTLDGTQIKDVYGNMLEGKEGRQGTDYVTVLGRQTALAGLVSDEPTVRPGITGATGPYVRFPEFTEPRTVPDGFNPHDKVETRVARLYYYRDAHRVAQIINRRVKSYNRHGVDMQHQLADKARTIADQTTAARQAAERKAIEEAQATRRIENQLEAAQRSLDQTLSELTSARRLGEPQTVVDPLDSAAQSFARQIESLHDQVENAREREIVAREDAERLESDERLARSEQFRREVAAAHADPDTYAPGRPRSPDPVEQVSVSVIGEGLIHLRGPIKGINTIRLMIDQIDSPLGQTRISVHTVQINGEDESRMEDVANIVQMQIDQSRFLTLQSSEMLRRSVVQVAGRKAEEARHLFPGESQEHRDRRYLDAFFGKDFIDELVAMDSEFLQTGNKILSLHSMDTTSLASALNLMALAKNSTREEILAEFDMMMQTELPAAEAHYLDAGITAGKKHKLDLRHPPKFYPLAQRARFESLRAFFQGQIQHDDTMTPLQREFIRLAQIFKSRLITEIEYKQRVMERAVIEERLGDRIAELRAAKKKEEQAQSELQNVEREHVRAREKLVIALSRGLGEISAADQSVRRIYGQLLDFQALAKEIQREENRSVIEQFRSQPENVLPGSYHIPGTQLEDVVYTITKDRKGILRVNVTEGEDVRPLFVDAIEKGEAVFEKLEDFQYFSNIQTIEEARGLLAELTNYTSKIKSEKDTEPLDYDMALKAARVFEKLSRLHTELQQRESEFRSEGESLLMAISDIDADFSHVYRDWISLRNQILAFVEEHPRKAAIESVLDDVDGAFSDLLNVVVRYDFAQRTAEDSRRPLDHKKFLDMLIDQLEEKYIELLEGTRAHTANVDNYLKRLTTALDDDFNTQFYNPTFRYVRETSTYWDVQFGQTETTSILTNNRQLAKVSPSATMEFDLPKRDILINEALNGAMANVQDFGALLNDPTFLAAAELQSPQSASTPPRGSTSGFGVVRDVLPGLDSGTAEDILARSADGRPQFGSNLENLIPDPAIYKFETGTGFEIRPVIQPDGQAVVFDFNYMYTTNVREPVRADEKHLGRVKRHYIDTDVQLSNFELREVSRYTVALKAARTSRGVPLLEDIPLVGALWRPLPSQESSLQQNVIMAQATIFPTLFDLMGLRWAPAVADLDPLRLANQEFIARGRHRELQNRVYDHSSTKVDEFLRIPEPTRRADLYRTQESVPRMHPNGYQGPGLDLQDSQLQEGYQPERAFPEQNYIPSESKEGAPFLPGRRHGHAPGTYIDDYPLETIAPGEPDPEPIVEPVPQVPLDSVNYLYPQ